MTARGASQERWSDDKVQAFRELWPHFELSASEIGRRLGMSKNSIVGKAHILGLEPRPSPLHAGSGAYARAREAASRRARLIAAGATLPPLPSLSAPAAEKPRRKSHRHKRHPSGVESHRLGNHVVPRDTLPPLAPAPAAAPVAPRPSRHDCAWPLNDGKPWRFCEAPSVQGRPFCAAHCQRAYTRRDE